MSTTAPASPPEPAATEAPPRTRRLEWSAISGVLVREVTNFTSYWRSAAFSSTVEPTIYLLAFGFGVGSLVSVVAGYRYIDFVATGTVATAVLFASAFPAMFGTLVKYQYQRTYDAILAAPVDTEELVTAEVLWLATRAATFGCAPLLVAMIFGLRPNAGALLVPVIAFVTGFGWASFGVTIAAMMKSFDNFSYVVSGVLTPLMLVAGTFFPLDNMPDWAQALSNLNPLMHCVELVRSAVFGWRPGEDLIHFAALLVFGIAMWRLAIWRMSKRLID